MWIIKIWRWYLKSKFMLKATFIACRCECDQNCLYRKKLHAYLLFVLTKSKNMYDILLSVLFNISNKFLSS